MNLQQIRAHHAFTAVAAISSGKDKFLRLARRLPEMLQKNGLLATWAFLLAKREKDDEFHAAAGALLDHLRRQAPGLVPSEETDPRAVFVDHWTAPGRALSGADLQRLTAEAIQLAGWIKRAAEALCDEGQGATP